MNQDEADVRKLHREVNQLVAQRFVLTTFAVTVFLGVAAWIMRDPANSLSVEGNRVAVATLLLDSLLLVLFLTMHFLRRNLRTFTAYIVAFDLSLWESRWKKYRGSTKGYFGYTKPQAIVFLFLITGTTSFPWIVPALYQVSRPAGWLLGLCALLGGVGVGLVVALGFFNWLDGEAEALKRWRKIRECERASTVLSNQLQGDCAEFYAGGAKRGS